MAKKKLTIDDVLVPKEEIPYEVPENWCWVKLGSIIKLISGRDIPAKLCNDEGLGVPYILGASNINHGQFTPERWIEEPVVIAEKGDILLSCKGTIGKTLILEQEQIHISRQIMALRCSELINTKYLKFYIDTYVNTLVEKSKGLIPGITREDVISIEIPLPPLAEQERIVNRIESLFDKVDKAAGLVDEAREGFEKRRAAILERAFSGELTKKWREENSVSDEWEVVKFKELGKLERGRSKHRPRNDERLFGGPYPFIQTGDIANSNGYIYHHKQTLSEFGLDQSRLFPKGTLCITIAANIGDVAILTYDCCFPDSVVGFTPNDDVESKFIYYYLNLIKRDLEHYAPATAQKNINLAILGALDIPKPSTDEQRQIVKILDRSLNNESKVEELIDLDDNINLIKKSILAKAFRGELASNDSNEESSVRLLEKLLKNM